MCTAEGKGDARACGKEGKGDGREPSQGETVLHPAWYRPSLFLLASFILLTHLQSPSCKEERLDAGGGGADSRSGNQGGRGGS